MRCFVDKKLFLLLLISSMLSAGCTVIVQKGRRFEVEKISHLKNELTELERAKQELDKKLAQEIADKQVKVEMLQKGLVITFVAEVLFDSGKADLRIDAAEKLEKVTKVLHSIVPDLNIGVEGHTDNEPIKRSSWKSNWELSSARALSVVHALIEKGLIPERLSASGYSEYHPVVSNDSKEGRQKNRRVEIVVLPRVNKAAGDQKF